MTVILDKSTQDKVSESKRKVIDEQSVFMKVSSKSASFVKTRQTNIIVTKGNPYSDVEIVKEYLESLMEICWERKKKICGKSKFFNKQYSGVWMKLETSLGK